jgi:type VI secretion system secreted protein VgrG
MSYPSIKVGDNLLQDARLTFLEVRQVLNEHWWCTFTCGQENDAPIPVQDWLGKELEITSTDEQKVDHTHFSGFILSVDLIYEASGTFSAHCTAVTYSWLLDQAPHKQYYKAKTLSDIASIAVGRVGLTASVGVAASKPLNYVQYGETDFSFLHRITDDYKAWLRPTAKGIEVFDSFQAGVDLEWRGASGLGLLDFMLGGTLKPASFNGSHYDHHVMESQMFQNVSKAPTFTSSSAGLASAVVAQSQAVMPTSFVQQRPRVMTLADFQASIEDEAERALGSAITGRGSSRNEALYAGNTVNITGSIAAAGTYGLIAVTHRWDAGGYGNTFTVTPWKNYRNSTEPPLRSWHGIVPACVTAHNDPKKMGRIQVQFFWQDDGSTHWARATSPHAGPDRGFMFMPEIGDEVAVAFEDGDPERPVILGSLWNGAQQAPRYDFRGGDIEDNDVKRLVTKSGNRIHLSDKSGQETVFLATPAHNFITLTEQSNETGNHLIVLHSDGDIVLSAPNGRVHIDSLTFSRVNGIG